jgi:hypothetical protein
MWINVSKAMDPPTPSLPEIVVIPTIKLWLVYDGALSTLDITVTYIHH